MRYVLTICGLLGTAFMLCIHYEAPDGSRRHNRLWNGGNGVGRIQLFQKKNGLEEHVDDILATHIGCEYGEYTP